MGEVKRYQMVAGVIMGLLAGFLVGITPYIKDHLGGTVPFIQESPSQVEQELYNSPDEQAQVMLHKLRTETQRLNSQVTYLDQAIKEQEVKLGLLKGRGLDDPSEEYGSVVRTTHLLQEQARKIREVIQKSGEMEKQLSALIVDDSTEVTSTLQEQERIIRQAGMLLEGLELDSGSTISRRDWNKSISQQD